MSRYTVVVTPWGHPKVSRTLSLSGRHSLEQLHAAIIGAFGFADDHLHAFFLNGHAWDREFGYFSRPDIGQKDTAGTKLDSLALVQNKSFLYLFDYGDEHRFGVRVTEIEAQSEGPKQPELLASEGVAPKQYEIGESEDELDDAAELEGAGATAKATPLPEPDPAWRDLVTRLGACLPHEVENEVANETEPSRPGSAEQLALATELLDRVGTDEAMLDRVGEWTGGIVDWLIDLASALSREDKPAEAWALSQRLHAFSFREVLEPSMARWAALSGERERALELIATSLRNHPEDAAVLLELGAAWEELGDAAQAERCYREGLRFAGTDLAFRKEAFGALLRLLKEQGRSIEARQAEHSEARWRDRFLSTAALNGVQRTVQNSASKVGRNDPCPCGTGKKYKKCCGAAG